MQASHIDNFFKSVVVIDDNLIRSKIWIGKLSSDFPNIQHFYTIEAALAEFKLSSPPHGPTLWMLDEYFYNQPISRKVIKQLLKLKSPTDLLISISRRPRNACYFDHIVGDEPRSWGSLKKDLVY